MSENFWRDNVIQPGLNRDVDEAVAEQQAILAKDPTNARAHFALGMLSQFQGEVDQAMQCFRKSIELNPADAAPHLSLGRILAVRGDYAEAWKHARAAEVLGACDLVEMLSRYPNLR